MAALVVAVLLLGGASAIARLRLPGWTGLLVALAVFGGDPRRPAAAVVIGLAVCVATRALMSARRRP